MTRYKTTDRFTSFPTQFFAPTIAVASILSVCPAACGISTASIISIVSL